MIYIVNYVVFCLVFMYFLNNQINTMELLSSKSNLKSREKINKKKQQLQLNLKLCPFWPVLIIKEIYDEIKKRRQN